jgi:hypothetical protein
MKHRFFFATLFFLFVILVFYAAAPSLAATGGDKGLGCGGGLGPIAEALCNITKDNGAEQTGIYTNKVISGIIGFFTIVSGLWFGIQMILGGVDWINSAGDKGKLETARNKIVYAIIGFGVVVAAYIIIGLVGTMMGVQILNPGEIINGIGK